MNELFNVPTNGDKLTLSASKKVNRIRKGLE